MLTLEEPMQAMLEYKREAFLEAVEDYIENCAKIGKKPEDLITAGRVPGQP